MCLVDIFQHIWRIVEIPQELGWTVLVIITKCIIDTWGIGLLETLWKVVEALIETRLRVSLQVHDYLHGFQARRGMMTDIMDLKLAQEFSSVYHDPLFLIFLDLK